MKAPQHPDSTFWRGRKVLVTGHTGFKGSWLSLWLHHLGAKVMGIALPPATQPNLFNLAGVSEFCDSHFCDIREAECVSLIRKLRPEVVFHLAAQPLVRASYSDPLATFSSNVMGTAHVLEALRGLADTKVAVMITTDKVYQNKEWPYPYREDDALGGHDPYSASKAASENVIASYRDAFLTEQGVAIASARAGNVIGGGDWSEDRLIPDAVKAWQNDEVLEVRRPQAMRPWQHVLEPLNGYLVLAGKLWAQPELRGAYNFGPPSGSAATVQHVVNIALRNYGKGNVNFASQVEGPHEAGWLALETAKAEITLGVRSKLDLEKAVEQTMCWYRQQSAGADARRLCENEIATYQETSIAKRTALSEALV